MYKNKSEDHSQDDIAQEQHLSPVQDSNQQQPVSNDEMPALPFFDLDAIINERLAQISSNPQSSSSALFSTPGSHFFIPPLMQTGAVNLPEQSDASDTSEASDAESDSSFCSSNSAHSGKYKTYQDDVVKINKWQSEVESPPGGYLNARGIIERKDRDYVFRAEKEQRINRRALNASNISFRPSNWFDGVNKMLDGEVLITSQTKEGVHKFSDPDPAPYKIYKINTTGIRTASLRENMLYNEKFIEEREGYSEGVIQRLRQEGEWSLNRFCKDAYSYDEVHISLDDLNEKLKKEPERITLLYS